MKLKSAARKCFNWFLVIRYCMNSIVPSSNSEFGESAGTQNLHVSV